MSRPRQPVAPPGETSVPDPLIIPGVDITQSSVQVMSFGGATTALPASVTLGDSAWTYPTLPAGISDSGNRMRYRKDGMGVVYIQGGCTKTTAGLTTGAIFTLPVGYRPGGSNGGLAWQRTQVAVYGDIGGVVSWNRVSIQPDGDVYMNFAMANGDWWTFPIVAFYAEN